jgi:Fe-S cluster biogenesis protein NfuA
VTQSEEEWDTLQLEIRSVIQTRMPAHNPQFQDSGEPKVNRESLSPELQKIEDILDNTIRPGLKSDGGDLEVLEYKDNVLSVRYQGACGTCPSAMGGTLQAIEDILRKEFHPEISVSPE